MVEYLADQYDKTQQALTVLGVRTLTLYRAFHAQLHHGLDDPSQPLGTLLKDGIADGSLKATKGDVEVWELQGNMEAPAIVSTVDGWATTREHAQHWFSSFSSVEVNCLMVAEVEPWAVLSWSSFGLGDKWPHSEEVLVLGGQGMVRWEVDGLYAEWSRPTSNV